MEHKSSDGYPVTVGAKFWNNDLRVCVIERVADHSNAYSDTGETQTWHRTDKGSFDTLTGSMQRYGRLVRWFQGKNAEDFAPGTTYVDTEH